VAEEHAIVAQPRAHRGQQFTLRARFEPTGVAERSYNSPIPSARAPSAGAVAVEVGIHDHPIAGFGREVRRSAADDTGASARSLFV
jgi:hypothetical protein